MHLFVQVYLKCYFVNTNHTVLSDLCGDQMVVVSRIRAIAGLSAVLKFLKF